MGKGWAYGRSWAAGGGPGPGLGRGEPGQACSWGLGCYDTEPGWGLTSPGWAVGPNWHFESARQMLWVRSDSQPGCPCFWGRRNVKRECPGLHSGCPTGVPEGAIPPGDCPSLEPGTSPALLGLGLPLCEMGTVSSFPPLPDNWRRKSPPPCNAGRAPDWEGSGMLIP